MSQNDPGTRRGIGCGITLILVVILAVAIGGWMMSFMKGQAPVRILQDVPTGVPPAPGAAIPVIDAQAGGRVSDQYTEWARPLANETEIPAAALRAYANAERMASELWPSCHLSWNTLAGLGYVETRHGTYSGEIFNSRSINQDGYVLPPIIGVPLDGSPGFAKIEDTDNGELDGDKEYDRAVGPMQFIPESWGVYGLDANGDGKADPNQIDDAALSAANLLCNGNDLATEEGWVSAIHSYNLSDEYLIDVRDAAASYALKQPPV